MFPCQDTPAVKATYNAKVSSPDPLVALMSAVPEKKEEDPQNKGWIINEFVQKIPIPSYLVALAVGALEKRDIGPRSSVWSEKEHVDAGAYFEFWLTR
jgi:leukotriene-A4 hydrolase